MTRGEPYTIWPPLMPALLLGLRSLGLDYTTAGDWIGLASHGAILFLSSKLLLRLFGSPPLAIANAALLAVVPQMVCSVTTVRNEAPLMAGVFACLVALSLYLERPGRAPLAACAACAALVGLQHYKGLALVGPVAAAIAFVPRQLPLVVRWRRAALFSAAASAPLLLWVLRNYSVEGAWSGARYRPAQPFSDHVEAVITTWRVWIGGTFPRDSRRPLAEWVAIVLGGLVLLRLATGPREERTALLVYGSFPLAYAAALVGFGTLNDLDPIGSRLLLPTLPFLLGGLLLGCRELWRRSEPASPALRLGARAGAAVPGGPRVRLDPRDHAPRPRDPRGGSGRVRDGGVEGFRGDALAARAPERRAAGRQPARGPPARDEPPRALPRLCRDPRADRGVRTGRDPGLDRRGSAGQRAARRRRARPNARPPDAVRAGRRLPRRAGALSSRAPQRARCRARIGSIPRRIASAAI
jgi:hypothetical protein